LFDVTPKSDLPDKHSITVGDVRMRFRLADVRGECKIEGAELRTYRDPEVLAVGSGYHRPTAMFSIEAMEPE
jgi:hypothetical protein